MIFEIGESVVVKPNVLDPDFGTDIGGWQGRVKDVYDDTIFIAWDSMTLREMGLDIVIRCELENLEWEVMTLNKNEVKKTSDRDSVHDVVLVADALRTEMKNDPRLDFESDT